MTADGVARPWAIRSTLIAVGDLDRSVAFYRELGPFDEIAREDAAAVLGGVTPAETVLMLREMRSIHRTRHGQQSLGLRSVTFNVGSLGELDRIESLLRSQGLFTARQQIAGGESELVRGRDPDNLPLVFVCYANDEPLGPEYYQELANLVYSLDT
jgi:catechol 2,3-dioxygenase-like lactoylglutathione lyase family enzyme